MSFVTSDTNTFLARTLGSNMVLQRDVPASVYGYSSVASTKVSVSFDSLNFSSLASNTLAKDGGYYWKCDLPTRSGSFKTYQIIVSSESSSDGVVVLDNVVFGDVFLCGGQSNMQFGVEGEFNSTSETKIANNYPYIRIFSVGQSYVYPKRGASQDDLLFVQLPWSVASATTVNSGDPWLYFSAVCWEFGRNVFDSPNNLNSQIPVGLISSNWGGTPVEAWAPKNVIDSCGLKRDDPNNTSTFGTNLKNPDMNFRTSLVVPNADFDPNADSALFQTMIYPFRALKLVGAIWYQGIIKIYFLLILFSCRLLTIDY